MICLKCDNDKPTEAFELCINYYVNKKRGRKVRYVNVRKYCRACMKEQRRRSEFTKILNHEKITAIPPANQKLPSTSRQNTNASKGPEVVGMLPFKRIHIAFTKDGVQD
jgi:hypothetical protein